MKRFAVLLIILLVSLSSCKKEPKKIDYIWTGQERISHLVPVCIVWYKKVPPPTDSWRPYKTFNQNDANDMREIILQLLKPEEKEPNPNLITEDKLSLIFYNGFPEKLTVREVYFEIKDQTFIGPTGKNNKLGQILLAKQEVRKHFYRPYSELGAGHYNEDFYRIMVMCETNHMEELKKIQEKTERELLILYKGNAEPNERSRLKEEWWGKIELEFAKYPEAYPDLNEIRHFKEDWWGKIQEDANRSRENTDQNQPATN